MAGRLVVLGTLASNPYAGMAWMHMQIAAGLARLGHDVTYLETTSTWPYDPVRREKVCDSGYAVPYLARVAASFGLGERWAYRRSYSDKAWLGPAAARADELLRDADAVFNVTGATTLAEEGFDPRRLVYVGTDPGYDEILYAAGDARTRALVDEHDDVVTYGENIGTPASPVPPLPRLRARMRQPILTDLWRAGAPSNDAFTTVCNWRHEGHEVEFAGRRYVWSKHLAFLRFVDLALRAPRPLELAMGLEAATSPGAPAPDEPLRAVGMTEAERRLLDENGWRLVDAHAFTTDPWPYRDYVRRSRGEFSVAKDQYALLSTGWFSERSACYLAAGRPVITQDTGFGTALPTGEGLFAFATTEEALAAFEAVEADYDRHSRAARELADEHFAAERVLARLLNELGL